LSRGAYKKLFKDLHGFVDDDFIPCAVTGERANDIHHIDARGMGGTKREESICNLIPVTRKVHDDLGDKSDHKVFLFEKNCDFILMRWLELKEEGRTNIVNKCIRHILERAWGGCMWSRLFKERYEFAWNEYRG